jgi:hypothetical protein
MISCIVPLLKANAMQVRVETYTADSGVELPRRFHLDGREIEVSDNLDQWPGADYYYFKVRGGDGNLYILRLDESRGDWELILFQSAQSEAALAEMLDSGKQPSGHV